jgi:hypothetical protein
VHTVRGGVRCAAWYLPPWQVRQLETALLTLEACSAFVWQPPQTKFLVIVEECWTARPALPLWQAAHLFCEIFLPAWRMEWQLPQFLKPGLSAWYRWNASALV